MTQSITRIVNHSSTATCVPFKIPALEAHEERRLELYVGKQVTTLAILVDFKPYWGGLGPRPPELQQASLLLYASENAHNNVVDYRYLEDVGLSDINKTVLAFSKAEETMYIALFASMKLQDVVISCFIGHPVTEMDDVLHPWRISRMYHVNTEVFDAVVVWLQSNRTKLVLRTAQLLDPETNSNPLHILCAAAGDPKLAKMYIERCQRFINPELQDNLGRTPIYRLLERVDIYDPKHPKYYRAQELLTLFLKEAAVSSDVQSIDGTTLMHLAASRHRRDSRILPLCLEYGAPRDIRNHDGKTPLQFAQQNAAATGMLDIDLLEVERLLENPAVHSRPQRSLNPIDQLPRRSDEAIAASAKAAGMKSTFAPLVIRIDDNGLPITGSGESIPLCVAEAQLKAEFDLYDMAQRGYLTTAQMRSVYQNYESFGVKESVGEIESLVAKGGALGPGKVSYDEFCTILFRINER